MNNQDRENMLNYIAERKEEVIANIEAVKEISETTNLPLGACFLLFDPTLPVQLINIYSSPYVIQAQG